MLSSLILTFSLQLFYVLEFNNVEVKRVCICVHSCITIKILNDDAMVKDMLIISSHLSMSWI